MQRLGEPGTGQPAGNAVDPLQNLVQHLQPGAVQHHVVATRDPAQIGTQRPGTPLHVGRGHQPVLLGADHQNRAVDGADPLVHRGRQQSGLPR